MLKHFEADLPSHFEDFKTDSKEYTSKLHELYKQN